MILGNHYSYLFCAVFPIFVLMKLFVIIFLIFIISFSACKHKVHILPNDEIYTCKEHVHVIDDHPAKCPIDGSELIKAKITEEQRHLLGNRDYERVKE